MTLYSSKTPRDLNHDPEPFVNGWGYFPRPEFDHVQHNDPNPLLISLRESHPLTMQSITEWLDMIARWQQKHAPINPHVGWNADHLDHLRRVLERLARLTKETA